MQLGKQSEGLLQGSVNNYAHDVAMSSKPIVKTPKLAPTLKRVELLGKKVLGKARSFDQMSWPGVPYGAHPQQKMEMFELNDLCPRDGWPAVILVHGGGWVEGTPDQFNLLAPLFVKHGILACAIRYRLSPTHHWSKALEDVEQALEFVASQQVDPNRIALWGESAGGHLALLCALKHASRIKCVVTVGAPTDLTTAPPSLTEEVFLSSELHTASPLHCEGPLPSTLLLHGTLDSVVPFKQAAAESLFALGLYVETTHSISRPAEHQNPGLHSRCSI